MKRKERPVLEILVEIDADRTVEFDSDIGHVTMIPFKGHASGDLFSGIIETCGVDTQLTNPAGVRHMSARYILTGRDTDGTDCHIYVENNAWFTGESFPWPFKTVPAFITDSKNLAPYLHQNRFVGEGMRGDEGLWIRFFELEND